MKNVNSAKDIIILNLCSIHRYFSFLKIHRHIFLVTANYNCKKQKQEMAKKRKWYWKLMRCFQKTVNIHVKTLVSILSNWKLIYKVENGKFISLCNIVKIIYGKSLSYRFFKFKSIITS